LRHNAVRISSRCMRWVPRGVAALGRSGQPASASSPVTKPSQPPADDCDWRLDLPGRAPAPAITRATAAHRSRAAPGSGLSRSSRRRTRRRHHGRARRGRAFGRRRNGHRSRARLFSAAAFRMAVYGTTGYTAGRALTGASVALTSRVSWVRPCSSERYRPSSFVVARAAAPLMSRKGRMTCCGGCILSDSREQQLRAYRRSSINAKNGTPRFLGRGLASAMEWFLSKNFALERISAPQGRLAECEPKRPLQCEREIDFSATDALR
jgi:hypothetical protein